MYNIEITIAYLLWCHKNKTSVKMINLKEIQESREEMVHEQMSYPDLVKNLNTVHLLVKAINLIPTLKKLIISQEFFEEYDIELSALEYIKTITISSRLDAYEETQASQAIRKSISNIRRARKISQLFQSEPEASTDISFLPADNQEDITHYSDIHDWFNKNKTAAEVLYKNTLPFLDENQSQTLHRKISISPKSSSKRNSPQGSSLKLETVSHVLRSILPSQHKSRSAPASTSSTPPNETFEFVELDNILPNERSEKPLLNRKTSKLFGSIFQKKPSDSLLLNPGTAKPGEIEKLMNERRKNYRKKQEKMAKKQKNNEKNKAVSEVADNLLPKGFI